MENSILFLCNSQSVIYRRYRMERMKKAISLLLVVAMLLTNCPVTAFASDADVLESGAFQYEVLEDGTLSICGYTGEPEDGLLHLEIPKPLRMRQ